MRQAGWSHSRSFRTTYGVEGRVGNEGHRDDRCGESRQMWCQADEDDVIVSKTRLSYGAKGGVILPCALVLRSVWNYLGDVDG